MSVPVVEIIVQCVITLAALALAGFIVWVDPAPLDHPTAIFIVGAVCGYWFGSGSNVVKAYFTSNADRR